MTTYFPIVIEREATGAVSAYVPGLPVYAAADDERTATRAIHEALTAYLEEHPAEEPTAGVRVARVQHYARRAPSVDLVSAAALVGRGTSRAKARSSRANGRRGGRPSRTEDREKAR